MREGDQRQGDGNPRATDQRLLAKDGPVGHVDAARIQDLTQLLGREPGRDQREPKGQRQARPTTAQQALEGAMLDSQFTVYPTPLQGGLAAAMLGRQNRW